MLEVLSKSRSFGGEQGVYRHRFAEMDMTFAVFTPPQPGPRPAVTFLSGLTCTHANVMEKGEYRRAAAELGLVVICPDVSPRGTSVPDDEAYDLGQGAGFYIDATVPPWSRAFLMETYITQALPQVIAEHFSAVDTDRQGLFGHSMGGHGALTLALKHPGRWRSLSAFAPIAAPSEAPWGQKAFSAYLGPDERLWRRHDAVALLESGASAPPMLVDVGLADAFLDRELKPDRLEEACAKAGQPLILRRHEGYDHSYFFISTFMEDHLRWHAERLS